jgi:magnesium chelatase family protein
MTNSATTLSRTQCGLLAQTVEITASVTPGSKNTVAVSGLLPDSAKRTSELLPKAFAESELPFPEGVVSVKVRGADQGCAQECFDLAIAIAVLAAAGQIPGHWDELPAYEFYGGLSEQGSLYSVNNMAAAVFAAKAAQRCCVTAFDEQFSRLLWMGGAQLLPFRRLEHVHAHLDGSIPRAPLTLGMPKMPRLRRARFLQDNKVPAHAKDAAILAAAGGHGLLFLGPDYGTRMTRARQAATLLPPLSQEVAVEVAKRCAAAGEPIDMDEWGRAPVVRAPRAWEKGFLRRTGSHGDQHVGKIAMAHCGVIVISLDSEMLTEFRLGQRERLLPPVPGAPPEESARFQLIVAAPSCGGDCDYESQKSCSCDTYSLTAYRDKLAKRAWPVCQVAAPLVNYATPPPRLWREEFDDTTLLTMIAAARQRQQQRAGKLNAELSDKELQHYCTLTVDAEEQLRSWFGAEPNSEKRDRALRVALTLADLQESARLTSQYLERTSHFSQLPDPAQFRW